MWGLIWISLSNEEPQAKQVEGKLVKCKLVGGGPQHFTARDSSTFCFASVKSITQMGPWHLACTCPNRLHTTLSNIARIYIDDKFTFLFHENETNILKHREGGRVIESNIYRRKLIPPNSHLNSNMNLYRKVIPPVFFFFFFFFPFVGCKGWSHVWFFKTNTWQNIIF